MTRPALTQDLLATEFQSFYWLKEELLSFCRHHSLSTHGSKADLTQRIALFLVPGTPPQPTAKRQRSVPMPSSFTRTSVIAPGWRCSQALRAFFQTEIGPHFHFDQVMRDFLREGAGKTLQQAIDAWQQPRHTTSIAPQFEYNRHMRAFFERYPEATRDEAIRAWNEQKAQPRPAVSEDSQH